MRAIQTYKETTLPIGTVAGKHNERKVWSTIRNLFDGCRVTLARRDGDYMPLSPLTFIAIVVQDLKKLDHVIVMITCGLSSLLFFDAPFKSYIIISPIIALFVAALLLRLKK